MIAQIVATTAAGGEVWVADETAVREFPPLRAGWSLMGEPANVVIGGRNGRRTILGALCPASGELVVRDRTRARTDDLVAFVEHLGSVRPGVPKLLIWDNAPPHHPHRVRDAAAAANITIAFLPFRAPELMPLEDLWRALKRVIAANRAYGSLDELVARAMHWLETMTNEQRRRTCALDSGKYSWLST